MASRADLFQETISVKSYLNINCSFDEWGQINEFDKRRLYLYSDDDIPKVIEAILEYNRQDKDLSKEEKIDIMLYINSSCKDFLGGMSLISVIEASNTPICTVNLGRCNDASFLVYITGDMRYSLLHTTFSFKAANLLDDLRLDKSTTSKFEKIIRNHIAMYSKLSEKVYEISEVTEPFQSPTELKKYGLVDEITYNIDNIL